MNPVFILIISTIVCGALGWWFGSKLEFIGTKKKIQRARDEKYGELKKMYNLTNNRSKLVTEELTSFVEFINNNLPNEITNIVLAEPKLLVLKDKGGIPDKDFMEALAPIIVNTQNVIAYRLEAVLNNITSDMVKQVKELMNDTVQEK
jgi:hypothetical protein